MTKAATVSEARERGHSGSTRTVDGVFRCIHCGVGDTGAVSVFCSTDCRDVCLARCGSKSTLGT